MTFKVTEELNDSIAVRLTLMLLAIYVLAFADRQLPAMLGPIIAKSFSLGDTAMGALHGYGFAFFYALMAMPAGWLVDRAPRFRLLALCLLLWSGATIASGYATSVSELTIARLVMGFGQAALVPTAYSLMGDLWPSKRNGVAIATFAIGPFLGTGFVLILGGQLATLSGWHMPFAVAGLLGTMAALLLLRLEEPPRQNGHRMIAAHGHEMRRYFQRNIRLIAAIDGSMLFAAMAVHTLLAWSVIWLVRSHGLALGSATLAVGMAVLISGSAGTLAAGLVGDGWLIAALPRRNRLFILGVAALVAAPVAYLTFIVENTGLACLLLAGLIMLIAAALASGPAALQDITPARFRGIQHGLAVFMINIIGLGLGPLLVGMASETRADLAGGLGAALGLCIPIMLILAAAIAFWGVWSRPAQDQTTAPGRPSSTV